MEGKTWFNEEYEKKKFPDLSKPEPPEEVWVNFYDSHHDCARRSVWLSEAEANAVSAPTRIACIKYRRVKEGDRR